MEYRIIFKQSTSVNTTSNAILERIHQVLVKIVQNCNITQTYVDEDDPRSVILAAAAFSILSTSNRLNDYIPGLLVSGRDIIILIKHNADWELIRQRNQNQINKDNIHKDINRVDHDYNVRDKFMINNNAAYKHETPFKGGFL